MACDALHDLSHRTRLSHSRSDPPHASGGRPAQEKSHDAHHLCGAARRAAQDHLTAENRRLREQLRETRSTGAMLERHIAVEALESNRAPAPTPARTLRLVPEPVQSAEEPASDPKG